MFENQAIVSQLIELGKQDPPYDLRNHVDDLVEKDINKSVDNVVSRLKAGEGRLAKLAADEAFKTKLRAFYAEKYRDILAKLRDDVSVTDAVPTADRPSRTDIKTQQRRDAAQQEIAAKALDALVQLDNLADDAYGAILTYCDKYLGGDTSPFEAQFLRFTEARPLALGGKVAHEHVVVAFSPTALESVNPQAKTAILGTPLGNFPRPGVLRSGIVVLDDASSADLKQGGATLQRPAFAEAINGSVFAKVSANLTRPLIGRRLGGWLRHDGDLAIDAAELGELEHHPGWIAAAAVSRTELLLLESWRQRLEEVRRSLTVPEDILKARIARHQRAAPSNADKVFKEIEKVCEKELRAVVAAQTKRFQSAMEESRIASEDILDSLVIGNDIVKVTSSEKPKKPGTERVRLAERIPREIQATIKKKLAAVTVAGAEPPSRPLFAEGEEDFTETAWGGIRQHIVLYWLGSAIHDPFLKAAPEHIRNGIDSEPIVAPVPAVIADAMLEEELRSFSKRCASEEFSTEVTDYNNPEAIYQGVGKLPTRLLAGLGPIFAITVLLGLGGAAIVKGPVGGLTIGWSWIEVGQLIAALLVIFALIAYVSLVRRQVQEKTLFAITSKARLLEMHNQLLLKVQNRYIAAANERLERSLADVLRRIKVHFAPHWDDVDTAWRRELMTLEQSRADLMRQSEELAAAEKGVGRVITAVRAVQNDLRKLAQSKILTQRPGK